jgi:hypothetical protein
MRLVRVNTLSTAVKDDCPRPTKNQGCFFALHDANDLPNGELASADLPNLLKCGSVWVGKAGTNPNWQQVNSVSDLPKFKATTLDNWDSCSTGVSVSPFMPQFFFAPRNSRGFRTLKRVTS